MHKIIKYSLIALGLVSAYSGYIIMRQVKYLLYGDNSKEMQLIIAARENNLVAAEQLVKRGTSVNTKKSFLTESTPLFEAIENGHIPMVALLLSHGALTSLKTNGLLPLDLAKEIAADRYHAGGDKSNWERVVKAQPQIISLLQQLNAPSEFPTMQQLVDHPQEAVKAHQDRLLGIQ